MKPEVYEKFVLVEDEHWWFKARRKYVQRLIERFIILSASDVFCEVGCGTGGNLRMLASHAPVDAVEMDASGRESAISKNVDGVRCVEAGDLPYNIPVKGPYKGVFSLDVIEHVEDDVAAVNALGNILTDDGILVLTVPAYQWMWSYHDEMNHHFRRYTRKHLVRVVEQAGLEVVYSSYFNTILSPMAIMVRFIEKLQSRTRQSKTSIGLEMPPAWINRILEKIFTLERNLAGRFSQPFGLSVAVVAKHTTDRHS